MADKPNSKRARRGSGAITLKDVAHLAGVSPITVSRALNAPAQVSQAVRTRVQDAIERTAYVPNRMAGGLASSRSRLIAAVVPSMVFSVFNETIEALNSTLFDAGYQCMLGLTGYCPEREARLLDAVIGRRPDGIFITGILPPGRSRNRLMAAGIPIVESWDLTPTPMDMLIGFSHQDIGRAVAQYLMGKGKQRLAVVTAGDERAQRRNGALRDAVHASGLAEVLVHNVGDARTLHAGREALAALMRRQPEVDAIFCSSDLLALGVITEARARNIAVPQRISVMGFGDVPFVGDMVPALSTVQVNGGQIGRLAAQHLMARLQGHSVPQPIMNLGFSIVERESA